MKMARKKIKIRKTEAICFGFLLLTFLAFSCKQETVSAKQIMEDTVEVYGGLDAWNSIEQLSFDKKVTLFLEDGSIQADTDQFQLFQFQKPFGKIEWEDDGDEHQIFYEKDKIVKIVNDTLVDDNNITSSANRAFFASEFVIKQPFDLLRNDVLLTLENDTIINNNSCHIISVAYKNEAPNADRWYYIIDKETSMIVANKVVLTDHTSWVENLTYDTSTDFKFNAHRKSYRLNKAGEKTYLRAEYFYSNYLIRN